MIVELIPEEGLGHGAVIRLRVSQVVLRQDNETPIFAAATCTDPRAQRLAKIGDPDFETLLQQLGVHMTVVCDTLHLPGPPTGARLLHGPRR
jgi:hypothetical protein